MHGFVVDTVHFPRIHAEEIMSSGNRLYRFLDQGDSLRVFCNLRQSLLRVFADVNFGCGIKSRL